MTFSRAIGQTLLNALPALLCLAAAFFGALLSPWLSGRAKRLVLAGAPLLAGAFVALGAVDRNIFTLTIGPRQPWYTPYTTPLWLICAVATAFPGVILFSARDTLGRMLSSWLGLAASVAWLIGLSAVLWRKGTKWFVLTEKGPSDNRA
jgi:hypothetical protein